ncbi:MAG: ATP-binding protein [Lactobacillaceae bacterium]|jgi:hypothetical protein|nr:ATP-binding protein [Lactobacillaceae bacterium]
MATEKNRNPFTIDYFSNPETYINNSNELYDNAFAASRFGDKSISGNIISGLRGSGKTTALKYLQSRLQSNVVNVVLVNSDDDILNNIYEQSFEALPVDYKKTLKVNKVDLKLFDISLTSLKNDHFSNSFQTTFSKLLKIYQELGMFLIVEIDEIQRVSESLRIFFGALKNIADNLPVYFIGAGLPWAIEEMNDDISLSFLSRVPNIYFSPITIEQIVDVYLKEIPGISDELAVKAANGSKGYPYLYQLIGYSLWRVNGSIETQTVDQAINFAKSTLFKNVYSRVLKSKSENIKLLVEYMEEENLPEIKVKQIRDHFGWSSSYMSKYRNILLESGVVASKTYGYLSMMSPYVGEYLETI